MDFLGIGVITIKLALIRLAFLFMVCLLLLTNSLAATYVAVPLTVQCVKDDSVTSCLGGPNFVQAVGSSNNSDIVGSCNSPANSCTAISIGSTDDSFIQVNFGDLGIPGGETPTSAEVRVEYADETGKNFNAQLLKCYNGTDYVDAANPDPPLISPEDIRDFDMIAAPCYNTVTRGNDFRIRFGQFSPHSESGELYFDWIRLTITTGGCSIACSADGDCDDLNVLTTDVCSDPGTCSSSCANTPCSVACSSDIGCDDSNSLTIDVCNSPGTCSSSCSNSSCSIACSADAGCDDSNSMTTDTCTNPGACDSSCSNTACTIVCNVDDDCDDSDATTTDSCSNSGTCSASCSNAADTDTSCATDSDCDDGDDTTVDSCYRPGTPGSHCLNEYVEDADSTPPTIECTVDSDCDDLDSSTIDSCYRPGTPGAHCLNDYSPDAAGPDTESPTTGFDVEFVREIPTSTERVSDVSVVVRVVDSEQNPVSGATVSVVDANGNSIQLTGLPNGQYAGAVKFGADYHLGENSFTVLVEKEGIKESSEFSVSVDNAIINIGVISPTLAKQPVGSDLEVKLRLSYSDGSVVEEANIVATANGQELAFVSQGSGIFVSSYLLADIGILSLNINVADSLGNTGNTTLELEVLTQEQYAIFIAGMLFLLLVLLAVLMLVLLFYMRFEHILILERQRAKYVVMKKHAQVLIAAADPTKKKELVEKAAYLDKKIKENEKSLALMRRRSWLTLGDIPMDLYFGTKTFVHTVKNLPSILKGKERRLTNRPKIKAIDSKLSDLRELTKKLENDFYKQLIAPDEFKKRLFDYREKMHLLEIRKKKLR